jgi:RHS repeat-associated protein
MDITDTYGNYVHRDNRQDTPEHDLGYTGHRYDDTTGLIYAKARYLDTETHGFLSPDPMIYKLPESYLLDPQQMNSYSYARNRITL